MPFRSATRRSGRCSLVLVGCTAAVLGWSVPAVALTVDMRDPEADAEAFCAFSGGRPVTGRVEIRASSQIEMSDEEPKYFPDRDPLYPKYRLKTTFKVKERYGRRWKTLPTRTVRTRLMFSDDFEGTAQSPAFPVLTRKYRGRSRGRIRAVKGVAKLQLLSASGSVIAQAKGLRFSEQTGGSCTLGVSPGA